MLCFLEFHFIIQVLIFAAVQYCLYLVRRMATINEVKSVIRGLLVSSPQEITVMKLRRDYRDQEGQDIPFYEFGFHDVTSFLRSLPDVCQIHPNANGPYAFVRLVESDKSAHVSSLVMRQRVTTNKKHRRPSLPSARRRLSQVKNAFSGRRDPKETFYTTHYHQDNEKKGIVNSNIEKTSSDNRYTEFSEHGTSYFSHNGVVADEEPCSSFSHHDYEQAEEACSSFSHHDYEQAEEPCPPSSHYDNALAEEQCPSFSHNDYLPIEEPSPSFFEEKSDKKDEVSHQFVPEDCGDGYSDLEPFVHFLLEPVLNEKGIVISEVVEHLHDSLSMYGIQAKNVEEIIRRKYVTNIVDDIIYHPHYVPPTYKDIPLQEETNLQDSDNAALGVDAGHQDDVCSKENLPVSGEIFVPTSGGDKIQRLERNLYSLMKDHCRGILGSELKEKYQMKFAAPLNLQVLGCETVWDLALAMPHIFSVIHLPNGDFQLFPTWYHSGENKQESKQSFVGQKKEPVVPVITKRNVQWLMQRYSNGLLSKDFEQTYKETFLGGIELQQMGFSSMEEFFECLEEMNVLKIQVTESDVWLLPSLAHSNLTVDEDPLPSEELMGTEVDMNTLRMRFPSDVVGPDKQIEQVKIPSWMKKSSMIEIFVQEVNSPHLFWITFCGEPYTRALDSLMDELQAFYCCKSHSYKMPIDLIRKGQDCVTQYAEEWHRARITCIVSSSEVEVCFYDYGTRNIVRKDNIHYLHTAHSTLPAQAIQAGLANIAPVEGKWTKEASKRFLQIIANKPLIGLVKAVDRQNSIFSLFLCDTSSDDDLYIHDVLIAEGFAVESTTTFSENKSQNAEAMEELIDDRPLMVSEQEEIKAKENAFESFIRKLNIPKTECTIQSKSIGNDSNLRSDMQEMQIDDFSKTSSHISLPVTSLKDVTNNPEPIVSNTLVTDVKNPQPAAPSTILTDVMKDPQPTATTSLLTDVMKNPQNVASNASLTDVNEALNLQPASTSPFAEFDPEITQACSKSAAFHQPIAPPPGFSCVIKSVSKPGTCDKRDYQMHSSHSTIEEVKEVDAEEEENEVVVVQTNQSFKKVEDIKKTIPEVSSRKKNDHREFAKGVSSGVNANFVQDKASYVPNSYPYPNWTTVPSPYPNFQVFPSVPSANVNSALAPLSFGSFPVPPLPMPLDYCNMWYYEQCRQQAFLQGVLAQQMAASTFPFPPGIYGPNTYSTVNTQPRNQMNISEVYSSEPSPSVKSPVETHSAECQADFICSATQTSSFSDCKNSDEELKEGSHVKVSLDDSFSDATVQTDQERSQLQKNNSFNEALSEKVPLEVNQTQTINFNESNLKVNSVTSSFESEIKGDKIVENSVDGHCSSSVDAIQKASKSNTLQKLSNSQISHDKSASNEYISEIEVHSEVEGSDSNTRLNVDMSAQKQCTTQIICDSKTVEFLPNEENTIENFGVRLSVENKEKEIPEQRSLRPFVQETCNAGSKEQEVAQIVHADSVCNEEISCKEDRSNEPEFVSLQDDVVSEKLRTKETYDCVEGSDSSVLISKPPKSLSSQADTYQSKEIHSREHKKSSVREHAVNFEDTVDRSLKYNQQLTVQRVSERTSKQSQLQSHFYHEENLKNSSPTSGVLLPEFGLLTISSEQPRVPNVQNRVDESIVEPVSDAPKTPSKIKQMRPVLGKKCSIEASTSIISGPTQPLMIQKTNQAAAPHSPVQTKSSLPSCDPIPSAQPLPRRMTLPSEEVRRPIAPKQTDHDSWRNVAITTSTKNFSKQTSPWHYESDYQETSNQFVKKIHLRNREIHEINLDGRPYVVTDEIVSYFTPFNGRHVILKILEARKVEINFFEISRRRRPELFESLDKSDIKFLSRGPTGNVIGSIHMVPLRSVPYMMRALNKDDPTLSMEVKEEMERFDPNDPYWSGHGN